MKKVYELGVYCAACGFCFLSGEIWGQHPGISVVGYFIGCVLISVYGSLRVRNSGL